MDSTPPSLLPPVQTIITGTEAARAAFDARLIGALRVHDQCIVVDLPLLETVPHHKTARLIAIVSNDAELYTATRHGPSKLAVIAICDLAESIRIRHVSLKHLRAPGVLLFRDGNRARDIFARIVRAWRADENDERAWGEPAVIENADAIIPPSWDSEGKISAVVDAAALKFDVLLEESRWGTVVEGQKMDLVDEAVLRQDAAKEKERARDKSLSWIERLRQIERERDNNPDSKVESVSEAVSSGQETPQSDFFQRLLAGTR